MVYFPRPEGFVQSVRQRRRALAPDIALVVVEGTSDKRALSPFLVPGVWTIAARGREQVLMTFDRLETELKELVLFIVDCDGNIAPGYKGQIGLVLTANRDIEADLMFELNALDRVAHELLADRADNPAEVQKMCHVLLHDATVLAVGIGLVLSAARFVGARVRVVDSVTQKRRKIRLCDAPGVRNVIGNPLAPSLEMLAEALGVAVGWSATELLDIVAESVAKYEAVCAGHSVSQCDRCHRRASCGGHVLVDATALLLEARHNVSITSEQLARQLRIAADATAVSGWQVAERIRVWEHQRCVRVLAA